MELAKKYCGMEMFLAAPLGLLLELFQFTAAACELKASDTINIKANLIIADACQGYFFPSFGYFYALSYRSPSATNMKYFISQGKLIYLGNEMR